MLRLPSWRIVWFHRRLLGWHALPFLATSMRYLFYGSSTQGHTRQGFGCNHGSKVEEKFLAGRICGEAEN
jgi:hypothetical protein